MGIIHKADGKMVEIIVQGHVGTDELLLGFRRILEDGNLPSKASVLINVTESEVVPPMDVMERIAGILFNGRDKLSPRLAVLVAHTVRFGKARQLGSMLEFKGIAVKPFFERGEALAWLYAPDA